MDNYNICCGIIYWCCNWLDTPIKRRKPSKLRSKFFNITVKIIEITATADVIIPLEAVVTDLSAETPQNVPEEPTEQIIWNFLIQNGYSKEQTAGIMGNLYQENKFNTGGDGIVQWTGERLLALLQRGEPYSLKTQLDFILYELNSYESEANQAIKQSTTIEEATISFQNKFERCGDCRQDTRISYAYDFYNRLGL